MRPALLASLFGYSPGGLSITIDVGRYWNLPYFYIPGFFNTSSVLFETAVCMTIYIGVMALEFAPVLLEKFGWKASMARLNKIMFFIGARGPAAHHAPILHGLPDDSGGEKIHPLWQSYELLPVFSLLTAFIMGFSIVVFEGSLVQAGLAGRGPNEVALLQTDPGDRHLPDPVRGAALCRDRHQRQVGVPLPVESLRLDVLVRDRADDLPAAGVPLGQEPPRFAHVVLGALSMLLGAALWRLDYSLLAFNPGNGYHYFPSAAEVLISWASSPSRCVPICC